MIALKTWRILSMWARKAGGGSGDKLYSNRLLVNIMKAITLKVKDIKQYINEDFGQMMAVEGFEYKKTNNEYYYKRGGYTYRYNLLLTAWSASYSITLRLYISQHQIEGIYESVLGKSRHGLTFYQSMIERLYYSSDGRKNGKGDDLTIDIVNDEGIYTTIETLKHYYHQIAKPYFGRFKTLEAFDDFINNPPFEYSPAYVGCNTNERCMKGLIVAKLVNNSNYEKLTAIYDELIKGTLSDVQPDSITNYNKVKEYLADNF